MKTYMTALAERIEDAGRVLGFMLFALVFCVLGMLVFVLQLILIPLTPLDLAIWIFTGKTPILSLVSKCAGYLRDF